MLKFKTKSGSLYQLDAKNKKIRRLSGEHPPVSKLAFDEAWQDYVDILGPEKDRYCLVFFDRDGEQVMTTSKVVEIILEN